MWLLFLLASTHFKTQLHPVFEIHELTRPVKGQYATYFSKEDCYVSSLLYCWKIKEKNEDTVRFHEGLLAARIKGAFMLQVS